MGRSVDLWRSNFVGVGEADRLQAVSLTLLLFLILICGTAVACVLWRGAIKKRCMLDSCHLCFAALHSRTLTAHLEEHHIGSDDVLFRDPSTQQFQTFLRRHNQCPHMSQSGAAPSCW